MRLSDSAQAALWVWRWWNPGHQGPYVPKWHPGPDNRWPVPYEQVLATRTRLVAAFDEARRLRPKQEQDAWGYAGYILKQHFRAMGVHGTELVDDGRLRKRS
jgi:hypothetical protein